MNKVFLENKEIENTGILQTENLLREKIEESDKIIKYIINSTMFLGSIGFLLTGLSSYVKINIIPFLDSSQIIFFPQGITMCFYGSLGLILSMNQFFITFFKVGEGFNEFDKKKDTIRIFRKGFPGRNADIDIKYSLKDIVRYKFCIEIKTKITYTNKLGKKVRKS